MATAPRPLEQVTQKVILHRVSWDTYDRLLREHQDSPGIRFNYDRGTLEIMIVSLRHEKLKHKLATLVEVLAEELGIDTEGAGSTTFRRRDLERGCEPDACFYFEHAARIRAQDEIDSTVDPPPDLVIEIDITSPSLNKLPVYAGLGVPEIWRYDGRALSILKLQRGGDYSQQAESTALPGVNSDRLNEWIARSQQQKRSQWLGSVRAWARSQNSS